MKEKIFNHAAIMSYLIAKDAGFDAIHDEMKIGVVSSLNSPIFNNIFLNKVDMKFMQNLNERDIKYMAIPSEEIIDEFDNFSLELRLEKIADIEAHIIHNIQDFNFQTKTSLKLNKVQSEEELGIFDEISAECFEHKIGMAFDYLKFSIENPNFDFFVGYEETKPVSCCMIAYIDGMAGLYWAGVSKNYRGKGYGSDMVRLRANIAFSKSYDILVSQNMPSSADYFKKIGFESCGSLPAYVSD
jgi:ribosomal protein S18 acetylase RimI-like enzyme